MLWLMKFLLSLKRHSIFKFVKKRYDVLLVQIN